MPKRIQRKRTKGWRKPSGAVVVSRPSKWGNPFVGDGAADLFRRFYRKTMRDSEVVDRFGGQAALQLILVRNVLLRDHLHELRGKDLCCWCPLDKSCHADVLIELANK